jgi:CubicO group peptidase (beta-lactamase class C family)
MDGGTSVEQTLDRATPESVGIPSNVILEWVNELERTAPDPHSLMVVRHGRVVAEGWWAPNAPELRQTLFSLSKSFTSTAVGIAIAEGHFGLDDAVVSFFPAETPAHVSPNLAAMKVRHLLAMCTGHTAETVDSVGPGVGKGTNLVRGFLALPVADPPGTHFVYNSPATYMLSAILQKRTGLKLVDYLRPRLFEPLGIENPTWEEDRAGINMGGFGLQVRTEEIARFGQLYLQKGMWGGKRLVPAEWVEAATSKQIETGPQLNPNPDWGQGYGYQFWRGRHDSFRGDGAFGQYCVVVPARDLVVAITSGTGPMHRILDTLWSVVLPALQPAALPEDPAAHQALSQHLAGLRLVPRSGAGSSALEASLNGAEFTIDPNPLGWSTLRFEFDSRGGALIFSVAGRRRPRRLRFGRTAWRTGPSAVVRDWNGQHPATSAAWRGHPLAASAAWPRPDRLELDVCLYTNAYRYTLTFDFSGPQLRVAVRVNVAFGPTDLGVFTARRVAADARAARLAER